MKKMVLKNKMKILCLGVLLIEVISSHRVEADPQIVTRTQNIYMPAKGVLPEEVQKKAREKGLVHTGMTESQQINFFAEAELETIKEKLANAEKEAERLKKREKRLHNSKQKLGKYRVEIAKLNEEIKKLREIDKIEEENKALKLKIKAEIESLGETTLNQNLLLFLGFSVVKHKSNHTHTVELTYDHKIKMNFHGTISDTDFAQYERLVKKCNGFRPIAQSIKRGDVTKFKALNALRKKYKKEGVHCPKIIKHRCTAISGSKQFLVCALTRKKEVFDECRLKMLTILVNHLTKFKTTLLDDGGLKRADAQGLLLYLTKRKP